MNARSLCLLLLPLLLAACQTAEKPPPPVVQADPYVGTYTAFHRLGDGLVQSTRFGEPVTITREGEGYVCSLAPMTLLTQRPDGTIRHQNVSLVIDADQPFEHQAHWVTFGFYTLILAEGTGPAHWMDERFRERISQWSHTVDSPETDGRATYLIGRLLYNGRAVGHETLPGDIAICPIGKFMYFGRPSPEQPTAHSGWLCTLPGERELFNEDGTLTRLGQTMRNILREASASDEQASKRPPTKDGDQQQDAAADPDPFVGTYSIFETHAGALVETYRSTERVTITLEGERYVYSREPDLRLVLHQGSLRPDPEVADSTVPIISQGHGPNGRMLHVQRSFSGHYLVEGAGPARWDAQDQRAEENRWAYTRAVRDEHLTRECLVGTLTYGEDPVNRGIPLGAIAITPVGKFMFFGDPEENPRLPRPHAGWLNTLPFDRSLFNEDGSLTEIGQQARATLMAEEQALVDAYLARLALQNAVTRPQVRRFAQAVQPGMELRRVQQLLDEHFNVLDHRGSRRSEGSYAVSYAVRDGGVTLTIRFVQDPTVRHERWIVPEGGAVMAQWEQADD